MVVVFWLMYKLFTDESGKNLLRYVDPSNPYYCVSGALIHDTSALFLQRRADQIKFKYWGKTDVTFHAVDMRHRNNEFAIFKGKQSLMDEFCEDFKTLVRSTNFKVIWVCVDKQNYVKTNPPISHALSNNFKKQILTHQRKLNEKVFGELWQIYLCYLSTKNDSTGTIVVEASDKTQDVDILSSYNKIMSGGVVNLGMSVQDVRNKLTSIAFVTKQNWDAGTEMADFSSYFLTLDHRINSGLKTNSISQFDRDLITILKNKTFKKRCNGINHQSCTIL